MNYSHDASGNVTSDGLHTFQYDGESRMVSVDEGATARSVYDSNNWRVKKETGSIVTHYVWEGGQVIAEYEFGGGSAQGTGTRYYEQDRLSTRVITNGSEAVVGTLDQLPFGEEAGTAGENEKHKFTSYERDSETGTDYAVNRQYQNTLGRFMRPDPYGGSMSITDPQSFNRYTYVGNDPVNSIDPLGLQQDGPFVDKNGVLQGASLSPESVDVVGHIDESRSGGGGHGIFGDGIIQAIAVSIDETGGLLFGGGGGGDGFFTPPVPLVPEPPPAPPQQEPQQIHCQPDVIEAMKRAWTSTGNGVKGTEAGFALNGTPSSYSIVDTKSANTQNTQKMEIFPNTFLLFHVHPNRSTRPIPRRLRTMPLGGVTRAIRPYLTDINSREKNHPVPSWTQNRVDDVRSKN